MQVRIIIFTAHYEIIIYRWFSATKIKSKDTTRLWCRYANCFISLNHLGKKGYLGPIFYLTKNDLKILPHSSNCMCLDHASIRPATCLHKYPHWLIAFTKTILFSIFIISCKVVATRISICTLPRKLTVFHLSIILISIIKG